MRRSGKIPQWASKRSCKHYVIALDDSGQKHIRPDTERRTLLFGGLVIPEEKINVLTTCFDSISSNEEIKANTFGAAFGITGDDERAAVFSEGLCAVLVSHCEALPFLLTFDKGETADGLTAPTRKGGRRVDLAQAMPLLAGVLGGFLRKHKGTATILVDEMGSPSEEDAIQRAWAEQVTHMRNPPKHLSFVDSAVSRPVQAADVIMGILRGAYESGRPLRDGMVKLLQRAEAAGLPVFHLS